MEKFNSIFLSIADKVSYFMGTPLNIVLWLIAVVLWIGFGPEIARSTFLPNWFTSNAFNFPLNTVTTLAELYIGFLVGASANRNERTNKHLISEQDKMLKLLLTDQKEEIKEEEDILKILQIVRKEQTDIKTLLERRVE